MKKIRQLLLVLLLVSPLAQGGFYFGNEMLDRCKAYIDKTNAAKGNVCAGYVTGIVDSHETLTDWGSVGKEFCLPEGVDTEQLARVALKHLESHPEKLHLTAHSLIINAFIQAFPCN